MTDPIADMLTRIRNANQMRHETVSMPNSKLKRSMLEVMKKEGFIVDYTYTNDVKSILTVTLKYVNEKERVIRGLKRISKPGLKVYSEASKLPQVLNGLGIAIVSTSQGVMTDKEARRLNVGGEVLAFVW